MSKFWEDLMSINDKQCVAIFGMTIEEFEKAGEEEQKKYESLKQEAQKLKDLSYTNEQIEIELKRREGFVPSKYDDGQDADRQYWEGIIEGLGE